MRRLSFLSTPPKLTGEIRRFCAQLAPAEPLHIKAVPFPGCDGDCFANLPGQVERFGGTALAGWRVAFWPRVLIQAERHLVWHSPKDEVIDVTPTIDRAIHTIFVPDPQAETRPSPVRHALAKDADLAQWIALADQGQEDSDAALDAFLRAARKLARPDDPCYCGSGRQLRKCHPLKK